jgi:hypothetical protein
MVITLCDAISFSILLELQRVEGEVDVSFMAFAVDDVPVNDLMFIIFLSNEEIKDGIN